MNRWGEMELAELRVKVMECLEERPMRRDEIVEDLGTPRNKTYEAVSKLHAVDAINGVKYHTIKCTDGKYRIGTSKEMVYYLPGKEDDAVKYMLAGYPDRSCITADTLKSLAYEIRYYPRPLLDRMIKALAEYTNRNPMSDMIERENAARKEGAKIGPRGAYRKQHIISPADLDEEMMTIAAMIKRTPYMTEVDHLGRSIRKHWGTYGRLLDHLGMEPSAKKRQLRNYRI